jgi:UDP-2,3-diacylglucosamine pyrophosphatase LpxH
VVGDLHLAAGPLDPFRNDELFVDFLGRQAQSETRLVLLGDLFDFLLTPAPGQRLPARPDPTETGALARLERIAAAHPEVIEALGRFARAGAGIDLVAGNHDIELVRPAVQARVRALLGDPPEDRLRFCPWFVYIPGLMYAEHGQQHRELNAFSTLLDPYRGSDEIDLPLGSLLAAGTWPNLVAAAVRFAARGVSPRESGRVRRYRADVLGQQITRLGLDHETLVALDAVTPRTAGAMLLRLARHGRQQSFVQSRAAKRIHRLLERGSHDVPFYVFGHTHVAERHAVVRGHEVPLYLNAGTWSRLRPDETKGTCYYIELRRDGGAPVGELRRWPGVRQSERTKLVTAGA